MIINIDFDQYTLSFDDSIQHTVFKQSNSHGISFTIGHDRFELIHSIMGNRILINIGTMIGNCRDIPFHIDTAHFLPENIKIRYRDE